MILERIAENLNCQKESCFSCLAGIPGLLSPVSYIVLSSDYAVDNKNSTIF